jgi:hypothetical protein
LKKVLLKRIRLTSTVIFFIKFKKCMS